MFFSVELFACILLAVSLANCSGEETISNVEVALDESLSELLRKNPHMQIIQVLERQDEIRNVSVTYQLGSRLPGDHLVAKIHGDELDLLPPPSPPPRPEEVTTSKSINGKRNSIVTYVDELQDFTLTVNYPRTGVGALISCVRIKVVQTSPTGQGRVISGGILQRHISVAVEAKQTKHFIFSAEVYGI